MLRWINWSACITVVSLLTFTALAGCTNGKQDAAEDKKTAADEKKTVNTAELYRTPGGIYTAADIKANGDLSPKEKYKTIKHKGGEAKGGEKICPISNEKANPEVSWIVQGQRYEFCCRPCVEQFLKLAHNEPAKVKDAAAYVKGQ